MDHPINFLDASSTLAWTNYLQLFGPIFALIGYFVFWVITTVVYERVTVWNDPRLRTRFGVQEYDVIIEPITIARVIDK